MLTVNHIIGSTVAKYAGSHVHERLKSDSGYQSKDYKAALKRAFLGTDDDLRAGLYPLQLVLYTLILLFVPKDPAFFHDPSGCTAVAALLTENKILVVRRCTCCSIDIPLTCSTAFLGQCRRLSIGNVGQRCCQRA
jgi:hypothetical protein